MPGPLDIKRNLPWLDKNAKGFYFSDTHNLKQVLGTVIPENTDYIVHAGDIVYPEKIFPFLGKTKLPVIVVLGNHDYWHDSEDFDEAVSRYKKFASSFKNIHVLENEALVIGEVRFVGTTLWHSCHNFHPRLVLEAANNLNDYNFIHAKKWWGKRENRDYARKLYEHLLFESRTDSAIDNLHSVEEWLGIMTELKMFHPVIAYQLHHLALDFLTSELEKRFDGVTVVVSHHPPIYEFLRRLHSYDTEINPNKYADHILRPGSYSFNGYDAEPYLLSAYGNPLESMFVRKSHVRNLNGRYWKRDGRFSIADIWSYGHLHHYGDFGFFGTRFINNAQYNYAWEQSENIFQISDGIQKDIKNHVKNTCSRISHLVEKLEIFAECHEISLIEHLLIRKVVALKIMELCSKVQNEIHKFADRFERITGITQPSREYNFFHQIADDVLQIAAKIKPILGDISLKNEQIYDVISVIKFSNELLEKMYWKSLPRNFENHKIELDRKGRIFNRIYDRQLIDNQILFDYFIDKKADGHYIGGRSIERGCWVVSEKINYFEHLSGIGRTSTGTMFRVIGESVAGVYEI